MLIRFRYDDGDVTGLTFDLAARDDEPHGANVGVCLKFSQRSCLSPAEAWAKRAHEWAQGAQPSGLPTLAKDAAPKKQRDVYVFFISAAKERNPAAAMALIGKL